MTKKKAKAYLRQPLIYPDSVRPPPALPDAASVLKMGFKLSAEETTVIRMAMAIHTASKQPKLTWRGWQHIAIACTIGAEHAKKESDGRTDTPSYIRTMSEFLRKTGFAFLNKDDRACAMRMLPKWEEIDAWRSSLTPDRQRALNNPREVEYQYNEHRRNIGDPDAKKSGPSSRHHRKLPNWLEQMMALAEQLLMAEERAQRAERESEYFAEMMDAIAAQAKMSDDAVAEIRAKVRAAHETDDTEEDK